MFSVRDEHSSIKGKSVYLNREQEAGVVYGESGKREIFKWIDQLL